MINIAIAPDDNYMKPAAVALTSLLENRKDEVCIFLIYLEGALSESSRNVLLDIARNYRSQMKFICLEKKYIQSLPLTYLGFSTYLRLFLPWALPNVYKIIYLDCDVIVVKPLDELFHTDIGDNYFAAVAAYCSSNSFYLHSIGFHDHRPYVNAGVLLMNLARLRQFAFEEKLNTYLDEHRYDIRYADQDIINVLYPEIHILHPRYNVHMFMWMAPGFFPLPWKSEERREAIDNPSIIHFLGEEKPWRGYNLRFSEWWWNYAELMPPSIKNELLGERVQGRKLPSKINYYKDGIRNILPFWLLKSYYQIRKRLSC